MNKLPQILRSTFLTSSLIILFFCVPHSLLAQTFNEGIAYYKAQDYKKAVTVFQDLDAPQANLFLGKSYYALGKYRKALSSLNKVSPNSSTQLYLEAKYTSALANYQRKEFGQALNKLYQVSHSNIPGALTSKAQNLYHQILGYLTAHQRKKIIRSDFKAAIKFDLLQTALGKIPYQKVVNLYQTFTKNVGTAKWTEQITRIRTNLKSAAVYRNNYGSPQGRLQPPKGTIYHIGIALPSYKPNSRNYAVVRGLYLGAVMAADQYNKKHERTKVLIHFVDTGGSTKQMKTAVKHFVSQNYGDVLIGPLFSRQLQPMLSLTSKLRIPAIAPLANKSINLHHSWLYQANPTYEVQGKKMAKFAVNRLNLHRFTIIAGIHSRGAAAARAFKKKARKLGATINHYFVRNLGSEYAFSKYTRYFGTSPVPIKAIYAPLNGSNALTLIDLLLRKVQAIPHQVTVMGAQEWGNYHFDKSNDDNFSVYYTKSDQKNTSGRLRQFKRKYRRKFKSSGNEFSIIGYDITTFILKALHRAGNPDLLRSTIARQPRYNGLTRDIYFGGSHVNQAVHIIHASGS